MFSIWEVIHAKKNVNILSAHYLQCNKTKWTQPTQVWKKNEHIWNAKAFAKALQTTKLPPPMKLQLVGQCKDTCNTNHKGETWKKTSWTYTTSWTLTITQWTSIKTWWTPTTGNNTMNTNNSANTLSIHWQTRWKPTITQ